MVDRMVAGNSGHLSLSDLYVGAQIFSCTNPPHVY